MSTLSKAGRSKRLDYSSYETDVRNTDHAIAIKILVKSCLDRFKRNAVSRYNIQCVGDLVPGTILFPYTALFRSDDFPSYLIATCRLFRANRRPATELTCRHCRAAIFQRRTAAAAVVK